MDESLRELHLQVNRSLGKKEIHDGRKRFESEEDTLGAIALLLAREPNRKLEASPCPFCDGWHIRGVLPKRAMEIIAGGIK